MKISVVFFIVFGEFLLLLICSAKRTLIFVGFVSNGLQFWVFYTFIELKIHDVWFRKAIIIKLNVISQWIFFDHFCTPTVVFICNNHYLVTFSPEYQLRYLFSFFYFLILDYLDIVHLMAWLKVKSSSIHSFNFLTNTSFTY